MNMKIAIDARSLEGNKTGVGRYLENILKGWKHRQDVEFVLYFKDEIPSGSFLNEGNFVLTRLENPLGFSSNLFFQHFLLPLRLKKDKADFFFSPFYLRPLFCPTRSAIALHDISYEAHPEWFDKKSQLILKTLSKLSAHKADMIFTVSEFSKSEIVKYYGIGEGKVIVTPLAPDTNFRKNTDPDKERVLKKKYGLDKFMLCVGTIFTRRHVPQIIEAFDKFSENEGGYQLCFVGKNKTFPYVDIDAQIRGVNDRSGRSEIVHLDFAEEDELMTLYSGCEVVIYLSDYEGFGLPVVEAQYFDKIVITSRNSSLIEVGADSVEFVEENKTENILQSLNRVMGNADYREVLLAKGRENLKRFSWQRCADRTLEEILRID